MIWLLPAAMAADADPFRPSGSLAGGNGTLQGESPVVLEKGIGFGAYASFAQDLAVQVVGDTETPLVRRVLPVEFYGAYSFEQVGVRLEVFAPVYLYAEAPIDDFQGAGLGDLRLQANVALYRKNPAIGFGFIPRIELPTGTRRANTRRGFQGSLTASLGGEVKSIGWLLNAGVTISEPDDLAGVGVGSAAEFLGGAYWRVTPEFRVGGEIEAQVGLVKRQLGSNNVGTWHVFAQPRLKEGVGLTVGAGSGLINGVGAPSYRVFAALTYQRTELDRDGDGYLDSDDGCPDHPEDFDGFQDEDGCPEADNDNDTIVDVRDDCPNDPEDFDGFQDEDGCPDPDNDGDGVLDVDDACPDEPGVPENNGCPIVEIPDTDGDGILDPDDACPEVFGLAEFDGCPDRDGDKVPDPRDLCPDDPIPPAEDPATSDGCPKSVYITKDEIRITERIQFETGKSTIQSVSFKTLDAVAALLRSVPSIKKLEVAGHTDNVGSDSYNQRLSEGRANAVHTYLIGKDVSPGQIQSKGYGESKPRDTNRTPEGRGVNRRVEFNILVQEGVDEPAPQPTTPAPGPVPTQQREIPTSDLQNPWDKVPAPVPGPTSSESPWGPVAEPSPKTAPKAAPKPKPEPKAAPEPKPEPKAAPEPKPAPKAAPEPKPAPAPVEPEPKSPWTTEAPTPAPEPESPWTTIPQPAPVVQPGDPAPVTSPWGAVEEEHASTYPLIADATQDPRGTPGRLTIELDGFATALVYLDNEPLQRMAPLRAYPVKAGEHHLWVRTSDGSVDNRITLQIYNGVEVRWTVPSGGAPTYQPYENELMPEPAKKEKSRRRDKKRRRK